MFIITILICIFCGYNEYRRRKRHRPVYFNDPIEQTQQEPSLLDPNHPQASSPSSGPRFWMDTLRRWKNFPNDLPSYNHANTTQSVPAAPVTETISPIDQPPAYEGIIMHIDFSIILIFNLLFFIDLYPNSTPPINTPSNSNE